MSDFPARDMIFKLNFCDLSHLERLDEANKQHQTKEKKELEIGKENSAGAVKTFFPLTAEGNDSMKIRLKDLGPNCLVIKKGIILLSWVVIF